MAAATGGYIDSVITAPLFAGFLLWRVHSDTLFAFQDVDKDPLMGHKAIPYLMVPAPRKRLLTMGTADRQRQKEITQNASNANLFWFNGYACLFMAGAFWNAGLPYELYVPILGLYSAKHINIRKASWLSSPQTLGLGV